MCRREGTGRGARQGAGGSGTCSARAARSLQVPMRLRGHGLRGQALRAGDSGVRVGALREQRVLPRGPRELPLPLLARCVRMRARAPGGAGAQGAVARPGMPVRVCAGAECAHVTAASLGLSFPICEAGLIIALTPGLLGAAAAACLRSPVRLFAIPWTVACQAPLSVGLSEYWRPLPFPSPGELSPDRTQVSGLAGGFFTTEPPGKPIVRRVNE